MDVKSGTVASTYQMLSNEFITGFPLDVIEDRSVNEDNRRASSISREQGDPSGTDQP